jgi:hypothetical protein
MAVSKGNQANVGHFASFDYGSYVEGCLAK